MNTNSPIIGVTKHKDPSINFDWARKLKHLYCFWKDASNEKGGS